MDQPTIVIHRDRSYPLLKYQVELDGFSVGNLGIGGTLSLPTTAGQHTLTFSAYGKVEKSAQFSTAVGQTTEIFANTTLHGLSLSIGEDHVDKKKASVVSQVLAGFGIGIGVTAIVLIAVLVIVSTMPDSDDSVQNQEGAAAPVEAQEQESAGEQPEEADAGPQNTVLYDGPLMKATLRRIYEDPLVAATVTPGMLSIQIDFENKSDKSVMFFLQDVSLNGYNVWPLGGNPFATQPGERSAVPFTVSYGQTDVTTIDDVYSVKFAIRMADADDIMESLVTTDRYEVAP